MEPASEENHNNPPVAFLARRPAIINRSVRLSDEEKVPSAQIIIRPEGEVLPERAQRVRSA
jgi:hypothetical protein